MIEKRPCFGTKEYSKTGRMCNACRDYIECCESPKAKKVRNFRDYKYHNG